MSKHRAFYTPEEVEFVKRNYTKFTTRQIANRLKKSYDSVKLFKNRNGLKCEEMRTKARMQEIARKEADNKRRIHALEKEQRQLSGMMDIEKEESVLAEMKALIHLAEITDNKTIRTRAKVKLMQLSEIPLNNPYSLEKY